MARPLRISYEGAVYHVTIRGNERCAIFRTDSDRERFIAKLAESVRLYDVRLYLFALMQNHTHFVLETPQGNLSRFMHRLQTAYTVYYNRKHGRSGHLFQGRFGSTLVDENEYILKLSRYVHLNPVFVKAYEAKSVRERIQILRAYPWSSYRSYIGYGKRLDFVDYSPVLALMGRSKKKQAGLYRRFVESGIRDIDAAFIETKRLSRFSIGSDEKQEQIKTMYGEMVAGHNSKEDVSFRREGGAVSADAVIAVALELLGVPIEALAHRGRNSMTRPVVAYALCRYAGCTQRSAAAAMGVSSGVAISLQLKKLHSQLKTDKGLQKLLAELKQRLVSDAN
jgi:putative transposase